MRIQSSDVIKIYEHNGKWIVETGVEKRSSGKGGWKKNSFITKERFEFESEDEARFFYDELQRKQFNQLW